MDPKNIYSTVFTHHAWLPLLCSPLIEYSSITHTCLNRTLFVLVSSWFYSASHHTSTRVYHYSTLNPIQYIIRTWQSTVPLWILYSAECLEYYRTSYQASTGFVPTSFLPCLQRYVTYTWSHVPAAVCGRQHSPIVFLVSLSIFTYPLTYTHVPPAAVSGDGARRRSDRGRHRPVPAEDEEEDLWHPHVGFFGRRSVTWVEHYRIPRAELPYDSSKTRRSRSRRS